MAFQKSIVFASGAPAPFTGQAFEVQPYETCLWTIYGSGINDSSRINIEYNTNLFNGNYWPNFVTFSGLTDGFNTPVIIECPFNSLRISTAGTGYFWVEAIFQY